MSCVGSDRSCRNYDRNHYYRSSVNLVTRNTTAYFDHITGERFQGTTNCCRLSLMDHVLVSSPSRVH